MSDTAIIEGSVILLNPDTPVEQIIDAIGKVESLKRVAKEIDRLLDGALHDWLLEHRELVIGDVRYFLGDDKTVKCIDATRTMNAILDVAGGDLERLISCLSSGCFKAGTTRKLFEECGKPELFEELFETTVKPVIREGKPGKKVIELNTRFMK